MTRLRDHHLIAFSAVLTASSTFAHHSHEL